MGSSITSYYQDDPVLSMLIKGLTSQAIEPIPQVWAG